MLTRSLTSANKDLCILKTNGTALTFRKNCKDVYIAQHDPDNIYTVHVHPQIHIVPNNAVL